MRSGWWMTRSTPIPKTARKPKRKAGEAVANKTAAILSLLRRYQALSQVHAASAKLQATLGMEPEIGSVREMS